MANILVRQATLDDVPGIVDFNIHLAHETEGIRLDEDTIRQGVVNIINDPMKGMYFVAELNDTTSDEQGSTLAGQLAVTYEFSDWRNATMWWIQSVYVSPRYRRKKVFSSIFHFVCKKAKESGVASVRLYADVDNTSAHDVYKSLGMTSHYKVFEVDI